MSWLSDRMKERSTLGTLGTLLSSGVLWQLFPAARDVITSVVVAVLSLIGITVKEYSKDGEK